LNFQTNGSGKSSWASTMERISRLGPGSNGVAWSSSCSRNAHNKNVLVRRAQSRINQATLENRMGIGITRAVGDKPVHPLKRRGVRQGKYADSRRCLSWERASW
jgi:hypothetical protein